MRYTEKMKAILDNEIIDCTFLTDFLLEAIQDLKDSPSENSFVTFSDIILAYALGSAECIRLLEVRMEYLNA